MSEQPGVNGAAGQVALAGKDLKFRLAHGQAAPERSEGLLARAVKLHDLDRLEEALELTQQALTDHPADVQVLTAQGAILSGLNRGAEARACLMRALQLDPDYLSARYNLSFVELGQGFLKQGFLDQEVRWHMPHMQAYAYKGNAPLWLGTQSLKGKTLLVHFEQGLGDTVQFVRLLPWVVELGGRVVLTVQRQLQELLAALPGVTVRGEDEPLPRHDFHIPLLSLPVVFGTTQDLIPGGVPYVHADPGRVEEWRERLGAPVRPRIGVVWAGRQARPRNLPRDMRLEQLLPLFKVDAEFISLQREVPEEDAALLCSLSALRPLGESLENLADTAALVATLDHVITVDTVAAHVAGAMGKRVWLMNRFASCWRWLRDGRTDSPWYPTVRIYRQPSRGDWESVVWEVKAALEDLVRAWRAPTENTWLPAQPTPAGWMRRAINRGREGDWAGAMACYTEVLKADPDHTAALSGLGESLGHIGCYAEALACFDKALLRTPDSAELLCRRGAALLGLSRDDAALPCLDQSVEIDPGSVPARAYRGLALARVGRLEEALSDFDVVLDHRPQNAMARHHRSLALLQLGHYGEGFRELESCSEPPPASVTAWRGETPAPDGILLVQHLQIPSDGLMLARYILMAAALWSRVLLDFPPAFNRLLTQSFAPLGNVEVLAAGAERPAHSHQCPAMRLPLIFRTEVATVPAEVPYLDVDPQQVGAWRRRLPPTGRLRVGLAWRAWTSEGASEGFSGPSLENLRPLLELPVDVIALHQGPDELNEEERAALASLRSQRGEVPLQDLAAAAALIATLDLVVAPDSAMAHLAAALGRPVWVLLSRGGSWRWLAGRADSPWYPTARVFRQGPAGEWGPVVQDVRSALQGLIAHFEPLSKPEDDGRSRISAPSGVLSAPVQDADALNNQALELWGRGCHEEALQIFEQALALDRRHVNVLYNRGIARARLGRNAAALESFQQVLAVEEGHPGALVGGAAALSALGRAQEALVWAERALAAEPAHRGARLLRGRALLILNRLAQALEASEGLLATDPDSREALSLHGAILWWLNRNAESRVCMQRVLAVDPDCVEAAYVLGCLELAEGRLLEGFLCHEIRWQLEALKGCAYAGEAPLWLGEESLTGKTILLHREQGLGDTLHFVRYVLLVAQQGARVILAVQPTLRELLSGMPGVSGVVGDGEALPPHDFYCPFLSLPVACARMLNTFTLAAGVPYLQADPRRVEAWRERLGRPLRPRIGMVWAGMQDLPLNAARSISLQQLLPLFTIDAQFISLQKDVPDADAQLLRACPAVLALGEALASFADTAALVATLDLIITVDTSVAHLAGALGKPVWVMTRFACCWRWLRDGRTDSPWYPTAQLFRQPALGDWAPVVTDVKAALEGFVGQWRPPAAGGLPEAPTAAGWMRRADTCARNGDVAGVIACYTEALKADPVNIAALSALGVTLGQIGCDTEALTCFDKALQLDPTHPPAHLHRALALAHLGRLQDAQLSLAEALRLNAQDGEAGPHQGWGAVVSEVRTMLGTLPAALSARPAGQMSSPLRADQVNNPGLELRGACSAAFSTNGPLGTRSSS